MFHTFSDRVNSALRAVTSWDGVLLKDTAGLFEFTESLLHLDALRDGFAGPDVKSVEAMWGYADANFYWRRVRCATSCRPTGAPGTRETR
jgi:hypothetical protein